MAYILGYFIADGSMMINNRGAKFLDFSSVDKELIVSIKSTLKSEHKIKRRIRARTKPVFRLQVGSKDIFNDLLKFGIMPNKTGIEVMPNIPKKYFADFLRGYFDGDGTVSIYNRKDRNSKTILTGFTCKNKTFLEIIKKTLYDSKIVDGGTLFYSAKVWRLCFSVRDSKSLYNFMYNDYGDKLYLRRKKSVFKKFFK